MNLSEKTTQDTNGDNTNVYVFCSKTDVALVNYVGHNIRKTFLKRFVLDCAKNRKLFSMLRAKIKLYRILYLMEKLRHRQSREVI